MSVEPSEDSMSLQEWGSALLPQAQELVAVLQQGDFESAQALLSQMRTEAESNLFMEIGKLTRQLHEALVNFQLDNRITDIAANDIPDARDRLNHVIKLTEQAANRTMDGLENCMPIVMQLSSRAHELNDQLGKLFRREITAGEFRELCKGLDTYLHTTEDQLQDVQTRLNDVILAQDYQDLTGQIIRRVINLVQEVEGSLVEMIRMFGALPDYSEAKAKGKEPLHGVEGPVVDETRTDVVKGQDDVDDLLSSLGF